MNKYQKIIRKGKEIQPGSIDTHAKFAQLTKGIDFKGKKIMDIGCNLGEMCRLAKRKGASEVIGVDRTIEYIHDARKLNPGIKFIVGTDKEINGKNDIIIASAMFHYVKDHDAFFKQIARCTKLLIMDVWLADDKEYDCFHNTTRELYIPTPKAFEKIASKYFNKIEFKGTSISPDLSQRVIYHLSEPKVKPPEALILSGPSNTGKTTIAKEHEAIGYRHLSTDIIFMAWYKKYNKEFNMVYSVRHFVDNMSKPLRSAYHIFHRNYIRKWLSDKIGHEVVIEGYDLTNEAYMLFLKKLLADWKIREIKLTKVWEK